MQCSGRMSRLLALPPLLLLLAGCPRTGGLAEAKLGDWVDYRWTSSEDVPLNPRCGDGECRVDGYERGDLSAQVRVQVVARDETTATLLATIAPDGPGPIFHRALTRGVVMTVRLVGVDPPADSAYGKKHSGETLPLGGEQVACRYSSAETLAPCLAPGWLLAGGAVARVDLASLHATFAAVGEGHGAPAPIPPDAVDAFKEGAWADWRVPDPGGWTQHTGWRSQHGLVVRESARGREWPFSTARQPVALIAELMMASRATLRNAEANVATWQGLPARSRVVTRSPALHLEETWLAEDAVPPAGLPLFHAVTVVSAVRQEPRTDRSNEGHLVGWGR